MKTNILFVFKSLKIDLHFVFYALNSVAQLPDRSQPANGLSLTTKILWLFHQYHMTTNR
jgi:hypothetical protein